jgi:chemotaxis protein methyltransferase CheR
MADMSHTFPIAGNAEAPPELTPEQILLADLLYQRSGQTLTASRIWRIESTLMPVLAEYGISDITALSELIASGVKPLLERKVIEALLNHESFFFRDRNVFEMLDTQVLPRIAESKSDRRLRIWSAGCSTGQEVYSLAMTIAENEARWAGWDIEILGTDLSQKALDRAESGVFTQFEIQRGLSMGRVVKFFEKDGETSWRIKNTVRRHVRFAQDNLIRSLDHGRRFDLVLCRNVLIYFAPEAREIAFNRFSRVIQPGGMLLLGAGETIMGEESAFRTVPDISGIYQRV